MSEATLIERSAERMAVAALEQARHGCLELRTPHRARTFRGGAGPSAERYVHDPRFFRRVVSGGEVALGKSYADGGWSTPDLVALIEWMLANGDAFAVPASWSMLSRLPGMPTHRWRDNSRAGSRCNIHAHYDPGSARPPSTIATSAMCSCCSPRPPTRNACMASRGPLRCGLTIGW